MNDSPAGMDQGYDADDIASEMDLQLLDSLSDILNARAPQLMPPPEAVDDLLVGVQSLVEQVVKADDLDRDFRTFLLNHLAGIETALRTVRIRGQRGLDEVVGRVVNDATRQRTTWIRFLDHEFFQSFQRILSGIRQIATMSNDVAQIAANTQQILGLPGSEEEAN
jgi:hypothetical protein